MTSNTGNDVQLGWLLLLIPVVVSGQADQYNPIYRGEAGEVFSRKPNQLVVEAVRHRKPGTALDVAMGQGRNAIFLAQQGWEVTGFDSADEGVRQAAEEARRLALKLRTEVTTIDKFDFGMARWDLIVLTYAPTKAVAPRVERALKPGGVVVVEDRHLDTKRVWPAGTFANNELISLFPGLRVLRYEDVWARPDWSARQVEERLVRLVAEKPQLPIPGCVWDGSPKSEGQVVCWGATTLNCTKDGWQVSGEKCRE
ncbi:MAG TPA: class I SAM-dependent methyltransferase [Bryobacteraceae bacterium]|nr:class I SAM-dependent methyltransferase [Bryobacteraceae bacterium]